MSVLDSPTSALTVIVQDSLFDEAEIAVAPLRFVHRGACTEEMVPSSPSARGSTTWWRTGEQRRQESPAIPDGRVGNVRG